MNAGPDLVGPVLSQGPEADAVIAAILEGNEGVEIVDRGAYLRVLAQRRCVVARAAIEAHLGRVFRLPGGLEAIMPSFRGQLSMSEDGAEWTAGDPSRET